MTRVSGAGVAPGHSVELFPPLGDMLEPPGAHQNSTAPVAFQEQRLCVEILAVEVALSCSKYICVCCIHASYLIFTMYIHIYVHT